jgi:hypothetical protein
VSKEFVAIGTECTDRLQRWYLISVKRDQISVKIDLIRVKIDLISVKRDLISVKIDLISVKRDLISVTQRLWRVVPSARSGCKSAAPPLHSCTSSPQPRHTED